MLYYKLRVDTDDIDKIEAILKKYTSSYIVCLENVGTDNTHSHSYLETTEKQATLRNVLRKTFGAGNSSYSLKELDERYPIEYLAYVVKEKLYRHNLPQCEIDKAIEYDNNIKNEMKEKKANRKTQLEKIIELNKEALESMKEGKGYALPDITKMVLKYYKDNKILVREFQIISLVQTLSLQYVDGYLDEYSRRIVDKMTK